MMAFICYSLMTFLLRFCDKSFGFGDCLKEIFSYTLESVTNYIAGQDNDNDNDNDK